MHLKTTLETVENMICVSPFRALLDNITKHCTEYTTKLGHKGLRHFERVDANMNKQIIDIQTSYHWTNTQMLPLQVFY